MKKFLRYKVGIIVVLFFLLVNTPIYAYEGTENFHDEYVYDDGKELGEETQEAIRETLKEFYNQTSIKAVVVTLKEEEGKTGSELVHKTMETYEKESEVVILFSLNRKIINCSYENIDIFPYIKSILNISENEYNTFVENSVVRILKQIAKAENKSFNTQTENTNISNLLSGEDLKSMLNFIVAVGTIIVSIFLALVIVIFIIVLCIKTLIDTFSS